MNVKEYEEMINELLSHPRPGEMLPTPIPGVFLKRGRNNLSRHVSIVIRLADPHVGRAYTRDLISIRSMEHFLSLRSLLADPEFMKIVRALDNVFRQSGRVKPFM